MKNLQIGYNLPRVLIKKLGMNATKLFVSGENLATWSPLYKLTRDLDVENLGPSDSVVTNGNSGNGYNYPILKSITIGLSATF